VARAKKAVEIDPNKLTRERAGRYVTPDGRFAVEGPSANGWYIVDAERQNELGLPLLAGPFATLDAARDEVVSLRAGGDGGVAPIQRHETDDAGDRTESATVHEARPTDESPAPVHRETATPSERADEPPAVPKPARATRPHLVPSAAGTDEPEARPHRREPPAPPAEPTWLTRLPSDQQSTARRLLALLELVGIDDPAIVRRELEANLPEVASLLLAREVRRSVVEAWRDPAELDRYLASMAEDVPRRLRPLVEPAVERATRAVNAATAKADRDHLAALAWLVGLRTTAAVFEALDREGRAGRSAGEPGWRVVELDGHREPTKRGIALDLSDLLESGASD
jgi:hypothetical protein